MNRRAGRFDRWTVPLSSRFVVKTLKRSTVRKTGTFQRRQRRGLELAREVPGCGTAASYERLHSGKHRFRQTNTAKPDSKRLNAPGRRGAPYSRRWVEHGERDSEAREGPTWSGSWVWCLQQSCKERITGLSGTSWQTSREEEVNVNCGPRTRFPNRWRTEASLGSSHVPRNTVDLYFPFESNHRWSKKLKL